MGIFEYTDSEKELNKILKMNQDIANKLFNDNELLDIRTEADSNIKKSEKLLQSLGYNKEVAIAKIQAEEISKNDKPKDRPHLKSWEQIVSEANQYISEEVELEDLLTEEELNNAFRELKEINNEFSKRTSIFNKTDLSFLAIATALQVVKSLLFPDISNKFDYGNKSSNHLDAEDKSIKIEHRERNDNFKNKHLERHKTGHWINLLYQPVPYDITTGSPNIGINMKGKYHRLYTLGHDPILGWIFGTANILTDTITFNNFQSHRVKRKPMYITSEKVPITTMFYESYEVIREDFFNLPAAIFAQGNHLKSDVYTKVGLPVPLLEAFNEDFAFNLYKSQYDALCLSRDAKITGTSYIVSLIIDIIIGLVHGLFKRDDEPRNLFEVRTRKILLVSNSIATSSSIISAYISKNLKKLDIGSLLLTVTHLFTDIRFITKIKKEFIENEIDKKFQLEFDKIDHLYNTI